MNQIVKPIPILFTFATMFGVFIHDMHIDRAATLAVTLPTIIATVGAADYLLKSNQHTHVERAEIGKNQLTMQRSALPKAQPPRDDDKRHTPMKRLAYSGGDSQSGLWPSV